MTVLHKVFHFCAAHRYHNPAFSEEENLAAFGEDIHLHGHNYELTISLTGEVNPATGFLADLGRIKQIVTERVLSKLDHKRIDTDLPDIAGQQPSTEVLVAWIWRQLANADLGCRLWRVRLKETPSIYTDYFGPQGNPSS